MANEFVAAKARLYVEELLLRHDDEQRWLVFHLLALHEDDKAMKSSDPDLAKRGTNWKALVEANLLRVGPEDLLRVHDSVLDRFRQLNVSDQRAMAFMPNDDKEGANKRLDDSAEDELLTMSKNGMSCESIATAKGLTFHMVRGAIRRAGERFVRRMRQQAETQNR